MGLAQVSYGLTMGLTLAVEPPVALSLGGKGRGGMGGTRGVMAGGVWGGGGGGGRSAGGAGGAGGRATQKVHHEQQQRLQQQRYPNTEYNIKNPWNHRPSAKSPKSCREHKPNRCMEITSNAEFGPRGYSRYFVVHLWGARDCSPTGTAEEQQNWYYWKLPGPEATLWRPARHEQRATSLPLSGDAAPLCGSAGWSTSLWSSGAHVRSEQGHNSLVEFHSPRRW